MSKEEELMRRCIDCSSLVNQETPRYWIVYQIKYDFESGGWYSVKDLSKTNELKKYGTPYGAKKYALNLYHKYKKELGEDLEVCIKEELVNIKDYNKTQQQLALTEKALELCYEKLEYIAKNYTDLVMIPSKEHFKTKAKEMMKSE